MDPSMPGGPFDHRHGEVGVIDGRQHDAEPSRVALRPRLAALKACGQAPSLECGMGSSFHSDALTVSGTRDHLDDARDG
jgi:hypothetical protein